MYVGDSILPLLACDAARTCSASEGYLPFFTISNQIFSCSVHLPPCELPSDRRTKVWYIAVRADSLDDTTKYSFFLFLFINFFRYLEFTVSARMDHIQSTRLPEPSYVGEIKNSTYTD